MRAETSALLESFRAGHTGKVVTASEAARLVRSGDTVVTGGFVGIGFPENVAVALEQRFLATSKESPDGIGEPRGLTLVYAAGQGDGRERGLNHLGHPGLVGRVIGGHWGLVPKLGALAVSNQIEAYNLPQGVISHLYRDIAGGKPGHLTKVGLGTFVDPRHGGGKINARTTRDLVRLMDLDGEEFLFFKSFPVDVAIIRATTSDPDGNLTMEREALTLDALAIAMAAHNSGGVVIAQVERIAERGTLSSRHVVVPGVMVDCVVVAESPSLHEQTFATPYSAAFAGEIRVPANTLAPMPMSERKIIARRAALELRAHAVVNLGFGVPDGVAAVAAEERVSDLVTLTTEPGVLGGVPAKGLDFGAAVNAVAIIDQPSQFDFYDGGGLDIAFLGLAQADEEGNLNVSRFGPRLAGAGGFINISQNARKVVFCGAFTAGGLEIEIADRKLVIVKEGRARKFVKQVEHRTFSGAYAVKQNKPVFYVTERCVFQLTHQGLELIEVAPGIDIERDILAHMDFAPIVRAPRQMDGIIFRAVPMGLRDIMLAVPFEKRFAYDAETNIMSINLERLTIRTEADVARVRQEIEGHLAPLGRKAGVLVNYNEFSIEPSMIGAYGTMVADLAAKRYLAVARYATSTFLRMKLGEELQARGLEPRLYETAEEARAHLAQGAAEASDQR